MQNTLGSTTTATATTDRADWTETYSTALRSDLASQSLRKDSRPASVNQQIKLLCKVQVLLTA